MPVWQSNHTAINLLLSSTAFLLVNIYKKVDVKNAAIVFMIFF
ncbi:MAG: hypothetical protein AAF630_03055 [Cyanobacteria bacterium P01_C01_bin.38]